MCSHNVNTRRRISGWVWLDGGFVTALQLQSSSYAIESTMAFPKTVNLLLFLLVVVAHSASAVSEKGRKLREDDGLQDLDGDWFGDGDAGDGGDVDVDFGDDFGDGGGGDDDFGFSFDELEDFGDIDKAEVLPYCEDLSEIELEEGAGTLLSH